MKSIKINYKRPNFFYKFIVAAKLLCRMDNWFYWSQPHVKAAKELSFDRDFDVIIANDLSALPLACSFLSEHTRLIFDAHEYHPREHEAVWWWRVFFKGHNHRMLSRYKSKPDSFITVCESIAEEYNREYLFRPAVIFNAPQYRDLQPKPTPDNKFRMIHHGGSIPSRKIESMIDTVGLLDDRFSLDLILVNVHDKYHQFLLKKAAINPRVNIIDPVPMQQIPEFLNEHYDIGLYLLDPKGFNEEHALPNKFFEFIQARLALAIGPSPEMKRIVDKEGIGVVSKEFNPESISDALKQLTSAKIDEYKFNAHRISEKYSYSDSAKKLESIVCDLL